MTEYEGLTVTIVVGGFILTVGGTIVAITRGIEQIKSNADKQISSAAEKERTERSTAIANSEARFRTDQIEQDRNFGEVGLSLRQFITDIEKKMFQIEIWARDQFATRPEVAVLRAIDLGKYDVALAEFIKDIRHLKRNFELHQQIYKDLNDEVIRLQKDVERLSKIMNGKH
jgi:hypothetical protein